MGRRAQLQRMGQRVNFPRYHFNPLAQTSASSPGRKVIWVWNCITYDFPSK